MEVIEVVGGPGRGQFVEEHGEPAFEAVHVGHENCSPGTAIGGPSSLEGDRDTHRTERPMESRLDCAEWQTEGCGNFVPAGSRGNSA